MENLVGQTLLGRYRLVRFIGRGGMAMVYEAWDSKRAATVAVKLMHEDLAEDLVFLRRFTREAETLARLMHPHIVRFLGFEEGQGLAFLVMEYVKGVSLRRHMRMLERSLTLSEALGVLQPVCSALHFAHQLGIYHCDIKPANVFIEDGGRVLLGDFGISRLSESATMTRTMMGTPAYMSPEQCRGGLLLDGRTDIYSLGISTYEMLTLDRPFKGEIARTEGTVSEKVRWEQIYASPPSPRLLIPNLPIDIEKAILRAIEKDPDDRFQKAMEFLAAIQSGVSVKPAPILPGDVTKDEATLVEPNSGLYASYPDAYSASGQAVLGESFSHSQAGGRQLAAIPAAAPPKRRSARTFIFAGLGITAIIILAISAIIGSNFLAPLQTQPPATENFPRMTADSQQGAENVDSASSDLAAAVTNQPQVTIEIVAAEAPTLPAEPPTATPIPPSPEPSNVYVLYALNASNDMMDNGEFAIAEQGLATHLQELDPTINAGFLAFGHQRRASENDACSSANVELRVPIRPNNTAAIWDSVLLLNPIGIAPIADAVVEAHNYFGFGSDRVNALILISDGENYCTEDEDFMRRVVNRQRDTSQLLPIYIFGIDLTDDEAALFTALLAVEGMSGDFFNVHGTAELTAELNRLIETLGK